MTINNRIIFFTVFMLMFIMNIFSSFLIVSVIIPYSSKFSGNNIFVNFIIRSIRNNGCVDIICVFRSSGSKKVPNENECLC